jgi:UDP-2,3-diacylglucosamine pyrophosphatase LpxH
MGCGFQHREAEFLRFLDALEESHDRIVLLGDLYQTEHGLVPSRESARRHLHAARRRTPDMTRRFESPRYVYLHGNHDEIAREELGIDTALRLEADGFAAYFIHGHQFDPVLGRAPGAARAATWFTGQLRRIGLRPVAQYFEGKDIAIKDRRLQTMQGPYASAARELMRRHGAHVVVMGHTHVARRHDLPEGVYVNTGSCSLGCRSWVSINTATRSVEQHFEPAVRTA